MRSFSRERIGLETTPSAGRLPLFSAARRASRRFDEEGAGGRRKKSGDRRQETSSPEEEHGKHEPGGSRAAARRSDIGPVGHRTETWRALRRERQRAGGWINQADRNPENLARRRSGATSRTEQPNPLGWRAALRRSRFPVAAPTKRRPPVWTASVDRIGPPPGLSPATAPRRDVQTFGRQNAHAFRYAGGLRSVAAVSLNATCRQPYSACVGLDYGGPSGGTGRLTAGARRRAQPRLQNGGCGRNPDGRS